ncbi:MAG: chemotaxis response regulator protein-glutamate methylesterase [Methanosarcinales archaeon]|nr:chemotaxis response regulator protein-glutamate methylesterase [Methanosarcinales archaeon]
MIRVLIVDDSAFMRQVVSDIINNDPVLEVIDTASNGLIAIDKVAQLRPDVILMDVEMPKMDGLSALSSIMKSNPTPVVMLSNLTQKGTYTTIKALEIGAVDFISKPSGSLSLDIDTISAQIVEKVKLAAKVNSNTTQPGRTSSLPRVEMKNSTKVIVIGASTGGPQTLVELLKRLPRNVPPIFIVQHMPAEFTKSLASRLDSICIFDVKEAEEGDMIRPGMAFLAPGGYHMTVKRTRLDNKDIIQLNTNPPVNSIRPSVDVTMQSVVDVYGANTIGVLLTGMGHDGAKGMCSIKKSGGKTIAQNEETCVIFGMPKSAIEKGCVNKVAPRSSIPEEIMNML